MRWTSRLSLLVVALWAAYYVWPYVVFYRVVDAVKTRDVAALSARVNVPALSQSLTEQIVRTYLRLTGREARLGQFSELAVAATASIADPIVALMMTPDALADLLRTGWPSGILPDKSPSIDGLRAGTLGNAWQLFASSEHGLRSFTVAVPLNVPEPRRFRLQFRLTRGEWKLAAVDLPDELRVRLTQELMRVQKK